jgi:hypothetical protein
MAVLSSNINDSNLNKQKELKTKVEAFIKARKYSKAEGAIMSVIRLYTHLYVLAIHHFKF